MKRYLLLALALLTLNAARADWTVRLPPGSLSDLSFARSTVGTPFGIAIVFVKATTPQTSRLLWYAPSGTLRLDYTASSDEFGISPDRVYLLGETQLLLYSDRRGLRLINLGQSGGLEVKDYPLNSSQIASFEHAYASWVNAFDTTGFYYVDTVAQTLSRVDFPKPSGLSLTMQSATNATGPWSRLNTLSVPTSADRQFFRIVQERN